VQTISIDAERIPQEAEVDLLTRDLQVLLATLAGPGAIKSLGSASSVHLSASVDSPSPDQIRYFAEEMQLLSTRSSTIISVTVTSSLALTGAPAPWASFPIDGHVFNINPSGEPSGLDSFFHYTLSGDAP